MALAWLAVDRAPLRSAISTTTVPSDSAAMIRLRTRKRVRCGDRVHATLLWVPLHVRVAAGGARLEVFRRRYGQDVYAYPDGGEYSISSQAAKIARCP